QRYDVIIYLTGFLANTGASVTDGTTTYFWQTPNPHDVALRETTNTDGVNIPVANYVIFSDLGGAEQLFSFDHVSGGGGGIGGFQVVSKEGDTGLLGPEGIAVEFDGTNPPTISIDALAGVPYELRSSETAEPGSFVPVSGVEIPVAEQDGLIQVQDPNGPYPAKTFCNVIPL
ncbi:MAG: hypothetical protein AAF585_21620, partial [Verrucomicrobiota bacterium]